jgi:putative ABC transport system permease protein
MWSTTIKGIAGHKRRFVSTCVAVVLGVAFLTGTLVLGDTIRGGFDRMFATANDGTAVVVRSSTTIGSSDTGQRGVVDPAVVAAVAAVPGVAAAEPVVTGPAQIVSSDGSAVGGDGPPTVGSSWIDDPALEPYRVVEGRAPRDTGPSSGSPDAPVEVVIDRASAEKAGLTVGDTTVVLVPDRVPVRVVGLVGFGDADSMAGVTFTGFAAQDASRLLGGGRPGVSQIRVAARPGVGEDELAARVATVLPEGTEAITGEALSAEELKAIEDDFLGLMQTMLVIFAGVALLVASFSIHNTFSIVAAQRSRESALMRAIGATRAQVLGSVVLEAMLVGVIATAMGVAAGLGLAAGLRALLESSDSGLPTGALVIGVTSIVVPVLVGLGVTLVAALGPALQSSRVSPLAALRATAVESARVGRARLTLGVLAAIGGVGLIVAGATGGALGQVGLGSLAAASAFVLLGPVLARPAGRVLGAPARLVRGVTGQLAQENAVRNPRRTAGTATALVIGIGVVAVFTVFGSSLRTSVDKEVSGSFGDTDLVVRSTSFAGSGLPTSFVEQVGRVDGVDAVSPLTMADVALDGTAETATVTDPAALARVSDLKLVDGDLAGLDATSIAVSQAFADDHGWTAGSTVDVGFADGATVPATIGATYRAKGAIGDLIVPSTLWDAHTVRPLGATVVLVGLADGADLARAEADVAALARDAGSPTVETRQEYLDSVGRQVNQVLTVVYVMLAVAVVIALLGIANTLTLSIHERTRELGMLRALGQTRRQLRSMIRWESAVVATFGVLAGLGLGTLIGWGLVKAGGDAIDISTFTLPVGQFVVIALVGAAAGVVAAWRPARRASRLRVLDAIAGD